MKIYIFIEHLPKYYDNMGGANNMINIGKDLKNNGFDVRLFIQNSILKQNVTEEKKYYQNMYKIFNDIQILDFKNINDKNICDHFILKCDIKKEDIIIATLKQYIDIFENFTKNILIYVHGGGETHMKYFHPLINSKNTKFNYPVIFYDNYWLTTVKIKNGITIDDNFLIFPYFTVHQDLLSLYNKCNINNKWDRSCFHRQKNKYEFELIHNDKIIELNNNNSLSQNIKILYRTKFLYEYDIHSLYVNFALLLKNNIIIPKYKNMNKNEFMIFYMKDSKRQNNSFFELLNKYSHYIENIDDLNNIKYIEFNETPEYLFDQLINKFHTDKFNSYQDMNNNIIHRLGLLLNNFEADNYLRIMMLQEDL
jgi:hypothetical protein